MAIKDISPAFHLKAADSELTLAPGEAVMGESLGGLTMYANAFKRGYGDKVFGSDENGIWLGAADYPDAPFSVDMNGQLTAKSATFKDENNTTIIDSNGLVSTASFSFNSVSKDSWTAHTGLSHIELDGMVMSLTLPRSATILILAQITGLTTSGFGVYFWIKIDGAEQSQCFSQTHSSMSYAIASLSPGNHTIDIQYSATLNGDQAQVTQRSLSYIKLGN